MPLHELFECGGIAFTRQGPSNEYLRRLRECGPGGPFRELDMRMENGGGFAVRDESFNCDRFNLHRRFRLQANTSMCIMDSKFAASR